MDIYWPEQVSATDGQKSIDVKIPPSRAMSASDLCPLSALPLSIEAAAEAISKDRPRLRPTGYV